MKGQKLLDILLANDFKDTTLKSYPNRYPQNELTNVYRDNQHRYFERNNFTVSFNYMHVDVSCETGMNGFHYQFTLEKLSMEHITMILLLSQLKGTQRYIFESYKTRFDELYHILSVEIPTSVPNSKRERFLKLQCEAQKKYQYLLNNY